MTSRDILKLTSHDGSDDEIYDKLRRDVRIEERDNHTEESYKDDTDKSRAGSD